MIRHAGHQSKTPNYTNKGATSSSTIYWTQASDMNQTDANPTIAQKFLPVSHGRPGAVFLCLLVSVTSAVHNTYRPSSSPHWPLSWWPSPESGDRALVVHLCVVPDQNSLHGHQRSISTTPWRTHSSSNSPTPAQTEALNTTCCQCYWLMYEPNDSV